MMVLALYAILSDGLGLIAPWYLRRRALRGKEDPARLGERFGWSRLARPAGRLVWAHAASVGESLSLLPVLERLRMRLPAATILLTTGTVTSAQLMNARLPSGAIHQFVPIDTRAAVNRFLDYWRPDLAMIVESELWPNLVQRTAAREIPLVLLNGRLSAASFRRWVRWPHLGRWMFRAFSLVLAQDPLQAERFGALGARHVKTPGDLKAAMAPPPAAPEAIETMRTAIAGRPVWLAASTHPGEEAIVIAAHRMLADKFPGLLTLLAPRHPARGDAVARLIEEAGFSLSRRSRGVVPGSSTDIYLIDTMGELGIFYRVAPIVLVAGSFAVGAPLGGHNPLEAAVLGCAVLHGPDTVNSAAVTASLDAAGASVTVEGLNGLAVTLERLLGNRDQVMAMGAAGQAVAAEQAGVIDRVMAALEPLLAPL